MNDINIYQIFNKAELLCQKRKWKKALNEISLCIDIPHNMTYSVALLKALCYLNLRCLDDAGIQLEKINPERDELDEIFYNLKGVYAFLNGNYQEASEYFELSLEKKPDYQEALINLADSYMELGLTDKELLIRKRIR